MGNLGKGLAGLFGGALKGATVGAGIDEMRERSKQNLIKLQQEDTRLQQQADQIANQKQQYDTAFAFDALDKYAKLSADPSIGPEGAAMFLLSPDTMKRVTQGIPGLNQDVMFKMIEKGKGALSGALTNYRHFLSLHANGDKRALQDPSFINAEAFLSKVLPASTMSQIKDESNARLAQRMQTEQAEDADRRARERDVTLTAEEMSQQGFVEIEEGKPEPEGTVDITIEEMVDGKLSQRPARAFKQEETTLGGVEKNKLALAQLKEFNNDKIVVEVRKQFLEVGRMKTSLEGARSAGSGSAAYGMSLTQASKAAGEMRITEEDINRIRPNPDLKERLITWMKKNFEGEPNIKNVEELEQLVEIMEKRSAIDMNKLATSFANRAERIGLTKEDFLKEIKGDIGYAQVPKKKESVLEKMRKMSDAKQGKEPGGL